MHGIADHPLVQALGLAVLHAVWQGTLFFCLLKILLSLLPSGRAVFRYRILYGSLVVLTALFCYTLIGEWRHAVRLQQHAETALAAAPATIVTPLAWQDSLLLSYVRLFRQYTPVLALIYAAGLVLLCGRMLRELLRVQYLRRQVMLPDSLLEQQFLELKEQCGIRRPVRLRLSAVLPSPVMLGYLKPVVLLPLSLVSRLDPQQVEAVLWHELAHIRRNDYFWNILQMVMEMLLFFNPVAWWISALIRDEREHCCDDYVLRRTRQSLPYAQALLALEEYRLAGYNAAMAFSGRKKTSLLNRIKRITTMKQDRKNSQKLLATVTVLVLLAATVCFATAFGQDKKQEPQQKTKTYSKKVVSVTDDKGVTKVYEDESGDPVAMEEALKVVPEAMERAGEAMDAIDWESIGQTVEGAMAQAGTALDAVNLDGIDATVNSAMKAVDWDAIEGSVNSAMKQARSSMSKEEWAKVREEVRNAMAEARTEMAKAREEMSSVNRDELRKAMQEAKEEMKKAKVEMKADMEKAKVEMKRAAEEMRQQQKAKNGSAKGME